MFGFAASPIRKKETRSYHAVYQNDYWQGELTPIIDDLIDRGGIEVTVLEATPRSFMQ